MIKNFLFNLIVILTFFDNFHLYSQYQNIFISNQYQPNEVSIMINPKNTNQIVAGSNIYGGSGSSGFNFSTNGGLNWTSGVITSTLAVPSGDPCIVVDTAGIFYYVQNSNQSFFPYYDRLLVVKSINGGMNWLSISTIGKNGDKMQDKPWACVDWSNSVWRNNIYVTWTEFSKYFNSTSQDSSIILFSKSTNGGINWSQPLRISKRKGDARDSSNTLEGAVPCTGPNGEIYVSWAGPISLYSGQYGIFFNKSSDGGNTWLDSERVATTQPGGWGFSIPGLLRCNGFPVTCCDISNGPYRGNIYINFSDQRNGTNDADIWLIKSTNGGVNWSTPKRVNNDPPGKQQFLNWMTVDQVTGYLYFIFYDQRNLPSVLASVYIARSTNGGETFQNVKVNTNDILLTNSSLGDYLNISAHNGKVRPIWTGYSGLRSIYTAIVDTFRTYINFSHVPIETSSDTSARTAIAGISYESGLGTGANAPRLYYKVNNGQFNFINAFEITGSTFKFRIPGNPPWSKISYYIAAQDSAGIFMNTLPFGGSGINPPGTTPPQNLYNYEIYSNLNQCSNTLPKLINDFQYTNDTIQVVQQNKYVNKIKVNLTIHHTNDGDLAIQFKGPNGLLSLSHGNGNGGANYVNTTFDDDATIPITQGTPPFTGSFKPQNPLSFFTNQLATAPWILRVFDSRAGNTGTIVSWCILMQLKNSVSVKEQSIPVKYELYQNYPNPFNPITNIKYNIASNRYVTLKIYDILGKEIETLVNEKLTAGEYIAIFNGSRMASGIYFYKLVAGDFTDIKRMVLVK